METIYNLYRQLEAADVTILLHVEQKAHERLSADLKRRASAIAAVQSWLALNLPDLSSADQQKIDTYHQQALFRDKKIVAVVAELRDKSKKDMMTRRQAGHVASPYFKKAPKTRLSV